MSCEAPVIIPSYNPDAKLKALADGLLSLGASHLVIVDDGSSSEESRSILASLERNDAVTVLRHPSNLGKGAALKTAFAYVAKTMPLARCVVTCDCDGQHAPEDVIAAANMFFDSLKDDASATASSPSPPHLLLGARKFSSECVPWKSRAGNLVTRGILRLLTGCEITDTQTGLRVIPSGYLPHFLKLRGNGFEYETEMLLSALSTDIPLREFRIRTVYHDNNRSTNFRPFADGAKIYSVILRRTLHDFPLFVLAGLSSALLDIGLFSLFFYSLFSSIPEMRLGASVLSARVFSCTYNYLFNRWIVFRGKHIRHAPSSVGVYCAFCALILFLSYILTKAGSFFVSPGRIVYVKAAVDTGLFFMSYTVHRFLIFPRAVRRVKRGVGINFLNREK